ncbi:hypothetical protein KAJ27_07385 [bacterium]|nr:hypothetical protein [bacterium]
MDNSESNNQDCITFQDARKKTFMFGKIFIVLLLIFSFHKEFHILGMLIMPLVPVGFLLIFYFLTLIAMKLQPSSLRLFQITVSVIFPLIICWFSWGEEFDYYTYKNLTSIISIRDFVSFSIVAFFSWFSAGFLDKKYPFRGFLISCIITWFLAIAHSQTDSSFTDEQKIIHSIGILGRYIMYTVVVYCSMLLQYYDVFKQNIFNKDDLKRDTHNVLTDNTQEKVAIGLATKEKTEENDDKDHLKGAIGCLAFFVFTVGILYYRNPPATKQERIELTCLHRLTRYNNMLEDVFKKQFVFSKKDSNWILADKKIHRPAGRPIDINFIVELLKTEKKILKKRYCPSGGTYNFSIKNGFSCSIHQNKLSDYVLNRIDWKKKIKFYTP